MDGDVKVFLQGVKLLSSGEDGLELGKAFVVFLNDIFDESVNLGLAEAGFGSFVALLSS